MVDPAPDFGPFNTIRHALDGAAMTLQRAARKNLANDGPGLRMSLKHARVLVTDAGRELDALIVATRRPEEQARDHQELLQGSA